MICKINLCSNFTKNSQICNVMQEKMPILPADKFVRQTSMKFILIKMSLFGPSVNSWLLSVLCLLSISCLFLTLPLKVNAPYGSIFSTLIISSPPKPFLLQCLQSPSLCRWLKTLLSAFSRVPYEVQSCVSESNSLTPPRLRPP